MEGAACKMLGLAFWTFIDEVLLALAYGIIRRHHSRIQPVYVRAE